MRKFFLFLLTVIVFIPVAYAVFSLSRDNSSDAIVKLLGPGATPSVCVARMRPHFKHMENAMTEIAEALLVLDEVKGVDYGYDRAGELYLLIQSPEGSREPTPTEIETFKPKFENFGGLNYFSPNGFNKQAEFVLASTFVECGVSSLDWARMRLGIGYERVTKQVSILSRYVYWPSGVHDIDACDDSLIESGAADYCEFKLNDNWSWEAKWATSPLRAE